MQNNALKYTKKWMSCVFAVRVFAYGVFFLEKIPVFLTPIHKDRITERTNCHTVALCLLSVIAETPVMVRHFSPLTAKSEIPQISRPFICDKPAERPCGGAGLLFVSVALHGGFSRHLSPFQGLMIVRVCSRGVAPGYCMTPRWGCRSPSRRRIPPKPHRRVFSLRFGRRLQQFGITRPTKPQRGARK
jgi:hypothetical protein